MPTYQIFTGQGLLDAQEKQAVAEANKALMLELVERIAGVCPKVDKDMIWIDLCALEPADILKFRTGLPPAWQEAAWYEALPAETKAVIRRLVEGE